MSDLILNNNSPVVTMSSREIAELTSKRHDHVCRDIRAMLAELGEDAPKFGRIYLDSMNRDQIEYALNRELTDVLLTGYSAKLRRIVIARWHELEAKSLPVIPQSLSAALRLAADQADQIEAQQAQLAIASPKAEALDLIANADGMLNLQAAGKTLQQQPNKFIAWLRENGWIYKRPGSVSNSARAEKFNAGYLATKSHVVVLPDGSERVRDQVMVTPKGLAKLAGVFSVGVATNA